MTPDQTIMMAGYLMVGAASLAKYDRKYVCVTCFTNVPRGDDFYTTITIE